MRTTKPKHLTESEIKPVLRRHDFLLCKIATGRSKRHPASVDTGATSMTFDEQELAALRAIFRELGFDYETDARIAAANCGLPWDPLPGSPAATEQKAPGRTVFARARAEEDADEPPRRPDDTGNSRRVPSEPRGRFMPR